MGQMRLERINVCADLTELQPHHYTLCTIMLESLFHNTVRAVEGKTTLEHTKHLRASCFRVPNPSWSAKASSSSVSINMISVTEHGMLVPALGPSGYQTMMR